MEQTQKALFEATNFQEKKKRAKANAQLKALGLTIQDLSRCK